MFRPKVNLMNAKLVVIAGKSTREEIPVLPPLTIGRSSDCKLSIAHPSVSRMHCVITVLDGALVVHDNRSANGTFINGERIQEKAVLKMGDTLTVGPLTFAAIYRHSGGYPVLESERS